MINKIKNLFKKEDPVLSTLELIQTELQKQGKEISQFPMAVEFQASQTEKNMENQLSLFVDKINGIVNENTLVIQTNIATAIDEIKNLKKDVENLSSTISQNLLSQLALNGEKMTEETISQLRAIVSAIKEIKDTFTKEIGESKVAIEKVGSSLEGKVLTEKAVSDIVGTINNGDNKRTENLLNNLNELKNRQEQANNALIKSTAFLVKNIKLESEEIVEEIKRVSPAENRAAKQK